MKNRTHARNIAEAIKCARKLMDDLERALALSALADALLGSDPDEAVSKLRTAERKWTDRALAGDDITDGGLPLQQAAFLAGVVAVAEHLYRASLTGTCEVCS